LEKKMNKKKILVTFASLIIAIAGLMPVTASASHFVQTNDILVFPDLTPGRGAATITRHMDAVWVNIHTAGLKQKSAFTVWWVVFNDPSLCGDACGDEDADFAYAAACYAGGFVTGNDGTANVSIHLDSGHMAEGQECIIPGELDVGNGFGAEIHVVIRSHGKMLKGRVDEQTGSYLGACDARNCEDVQAAVFLSTVP
jgi:hypothetical protein